MKTNPGIILDSTSCETFSLSVYSIEKIPGGFIIHPVGPLDLSSYVILEEKVELILATAPKVIIFDMEHVHYINGRGLRVILRTIKQMKQRSRRVYLINLQVQIMEMFEIINGLVPPWIFADPEELENLLLKFGTPKIEQTAD